MFLTKTNIRFVVVVWIFVSSQVLGENSIFLFAAASEIIRRPPADGGDDSRRRRADRGHGRHSGPGEDPDAAADSGREMEGAAGQSRRPVSLTVVSSLLSTLTGSLGHVTHLKPPHPHLLPPLVSPPSGSGSWRSCRCWLFSSTRPWNLWENGWAPPSGAWAPPSPWEPRRPKSRSKYWSTRYCWSEP